MSKKINFNSCCREVLVLVTKVKGDLLTAMCFIGKKRGKKSLNRNVDLLLDREKNFGAHAVDVLFCIMEGINELKGQSANVRTKSVARDRQQRAREHQAPRQKGQRFGTKKTWAELGVA